MNNRLLKSKIFSELRKQYNDFSEIDDSRLNVIIFHHPSGMRLSSSGFSAIKKLFDFYKFDIPENMKSRCNLALNKLEYPYYFISKKIYVFSEIDATMIKLSGGIDSFLDSQTYT